MLHVEHERAAAARRLLDRTRREPAPYASLGTDCRVWTGARDQQGYGRVRRGRRIFRPHRLLFETLHGEIPDGKIVRHRCDRPACIEPTHLELGTHRENATHAFDRGRQGPRTLEDCERSLTRARRSRARLDRRIRDLEALREELLGGDA